MTLALAVDAPRWMTTTPGYPAIEADQASAIPLLPLLSVITPETRLETSG